MLRFVIRKMLSKKWMILSLLIGNILLISIAAGNPMYTHAVFQRTITKNLENYLNTKNAYPGLINFKIKSQTDELAKVREHMAVVDGMPEAFGVDALHTITHYSTIKSSADLEVVRDDADDQRLTIACLSDLEQHIDLVAGRMFSAEPDENGVYDAILSEKAIINQNLMLDDVLTFSRIVDEKEEPLKVRVAGVFTNSSDEDIYWVRTPSSYHDTLFIAQEAFEQRFLSTEELPWLINANWYVLLDYTAMRGENVPQMLAVADGYRHRFNGNAVRAYNDNFSDVFTAYMTTTQKVQVTLWVLQVPIFMLLAAFIFMVSRQMLEIEQSEIAVIKSRGAGKMQIFGIYLIQSLLVSAIAFAAGIPLGMYLCQVLGSANAFLEFVRRSALPMEVTTEALIYAGAASLLSICAMVLPALRYSRTGIVNAKRQKHRKATPLWQKLGLDLIALLVALYGLYSFNGQKEILSARVLEGASLDPLLFLSSSLFMIGCGLLAVRVVPLLVWLVYRLFRRWWSPAMYASFLHVLRTRSSQSFIMVFLIMTIALGVFNAQAARTINQNAEDNLYYTIGADVVLQEKWDSTESTDTEGSAASASEVIYYEPDFGRFEGLEEAEAVTRVYVNQSANVSVSGGGTIKNIQLMGIHTREFGSVAWYKDSLSDVHWYHYLNAMAQNSRAVLVSRNFADKHGYELGDSITYRTNNSDSMRGVIYGFVDYFPGWVPVTYAKGSNGLYEEKENYLIVAHLSQLQSSMGVMPYQVWIRNRDSSSYLYDFAENNSKGFSTFRDAKAELIEKKNDPILQGTNGILTVGFIVVLLLCSVGFLIFWILSIQSRSLLFGIFRAMGMTMREVFTMLINEQVFISGLSIAVGALVGHLTARFYMPLIQLAYAASDNALQLELISHSTDTVRLFGVIGAVMLVCMLILGMLISRMKVTQALKLGED
ncbi:MAG: ABC transporter permease [Clostridia bacterium]|nr:ABC transporter permease [Clostridia bacterium]